MSWEAWGTPPDPEPRYCPVCDQESHSHDCELGRMQARAFLAEQQRDELLAAKGKVSVTLTGKEIREIAELAGLQFVEHDYTDEYETEIAIESCPDKGILNDDNAPEHYRLIAFLNEYPEEGCIGLGEKIEATAIASVKEK